MTDTKTCMKCKAVKPLDEFLQNSRCKDGRNYYCKECLRSKGRRSRRRSLKAVLTDFNKAIRSAEQEGCEITLKDTGLVYPRYSLSLMQSMTITTDDE